MRMNVFNVSKHDDLDKSFSKKLNLTDSLDQKTESLNKKLNYGTYISNINHSKKNLFSNLNSSLNENKSQNFVGREKCFFKNMNQDEVDSNLIPNFFTKFFSSKTKKTNNDFFSSNVGKKISHNKLTNFLTPSFLNNETKNKNILINSNKTHDNLNDSDYFDFEYNIEDYAQKNNVHTGSQSLIPLESPPIKQNNVTDIVLFTNQKKGTDTKLDLRKNKYFDLDEISNNISDGTMKKKKLSSSLYSSNDLVKNSPDMLNKNDKKCTCFLNSEIISHDSLKNVQNNHLSPYDSFSTSKKYINNDTFNRFYCHRSCSSSQNIFHVSFYCIQLIIITIAIFYGTFLLYNIINTIKYDINQKIKAQSYNLLTEIDHCREAYHENCTPSSFVPILESQCKIWKKCSNQAPFNVSNVSKIAAETIGILINSLIDPLSYKFFFIIFLFILFFTLYNFFFTSLGYSSYNLSKKSPYYLHSHSIKDKKN